MEIVALVVWCFLVALAGGLVGLVLGNLRLPLVLILASSPAAAGGANIAISGVAAATASVTHVRAGRVNWRLFGWMAPPSIAGALGGGSLAGVISGDLLLAVIATVLAYSGVDLLRWEPRSDPVPGGAGGERRASAASADRGPEAAPEPTAGDPPARTPPRPDRALDIRAAVIAGAVIGLLGGLVGLILGSLRMPALLKLVGESADRAVGTNLTVGVCVGAAGLIGHLPEAAPDLDILLIGAAASVPGAILGARLTGRLSERQLVRAIGAALIVAAVAAAVQAIT